MLKMNRTSLHKTHYALRGLVFCTLVLLWCASSHSQGVTVEEARKNGLKMLKVVKGQIERTYYDKNFHGLDLDLRFKRAEEKMSEADSSGQVVGIIAQAVLDLNDSHTRLIPPLGNSVAVYGWRMQMVGDDCYITAVMPGSDAEVKGLMPGDRVVSLDGYYPTRENLWKLQYFYYTLRPQSRVNISVQSPTGAERTVEIITRIHKRKLVSSYGWIVDKDPVQVTADDGTGPSPQYFEFGESLIVCRLPSFSIEEEMVDKVMERIAGHKTLVLDLRGNPGGHIFALMRFSSHFFDREVKMDDVKMRDGMKEEKIKPRKKNNFSGKLIVLVDSRSSSAAEVFARLVQLEKRGLVVGDHTSGMVMQSLHYSFQLGDRDKLVLYGLSVTIADVIMTDGKSLERVGVTPDELLLPTGADLRNRRDPVLAHAAVMAGVSLTPEKAGDLFVQDALSNQ
jgi:C-terminal processing protease CtpA/Prc